MATLRVVPVRHGGNWNPEPLAWKRFAILMGNRHKVRVDLAPPTALVDLDAGRCPAAVMTGTTSFELTDAEAAAVRKFLTAGGTLVVDAGAAEALSHRGKSLLPSGIAAVDGKFAKGANVAVVDPRGGQIARGLSNYSSEQIEQIKGLKSSQIARVLGDKPYDEVIHRNNMTLG